MTNAAAAVTDTYNCDAFGNRIGSSGTTPNNYMYRGEQYDPDLGLYYLRARYYNPATGRFLSRDPEDGTPTNPKTLHKYLYAAGDPLNRTDPSGRAEFEDYVDTAIWVAKTACYVINASVVLYELESLKELGHFTDPGSPWKIGVGCSTVAAFFLALYIGGPVEIS